MRLFEKRESPDRRYEALEAEYRNFRRRTAAELEEAHAKAAKETVLPFLDIYDDLQRALSTPCRDEAYCKGIRLIYDNLMLTFRSLKIVPMDSKGKIFNPTYHDAVQCIEDKRFRAEEITEVLQVGFLMDDEVIRHAKVIVANCD